TNMIITDNSASADGGGVSMENAPSSTPWTLTINSSTISNNHAGDAGGGVEEDGSGHVVINTGTVITGNTSVNQGAGIWLDAIGNDTASLNVNGATISDNRALSELAFGGGIGNSGNGTVTLSNTTVEGNSSGGFGGGFGDQGNIGTLNVVDCLFLDNVAANAGGGIQEGGPSTSITNSQIQLNSSGGNGGG